MKTNSQTNTEKTKTKIQIYIKLKTIYSSPQQKRPDR